MLQVNSDWRDGGGYVVAIYGSGDVTTCEQNSKL